MIEMIKSITAFWAVLVVLGGMAYSVAGDSIVPAMRSWVVTQNAPLAQGQQGIANALRSIAIDQETGKREAAERERDRLELDALKVTDEIERLKVNQLKRRTEDTIGKLNDKIRNLELSK